MSPKYWDNVPVYKRIILPDDKRDRLYNAFLINEDDLLIMTEARFILMNTQLEELKRVEIVDSNKYFSGFTGANANNYDPEDDRFFFAIDVGLKKIDGHEDPRDLPNVYTGTNTKSGYHAWVMKANVATDTLKITCDFKSNSALLKHSYVWSSLEYAPNKFIMYTDENGNELYIVHDWKVISVIDDP